MHTLATSDFLFGLPNTLLVWAVVGAGTIFLLDRTSLGRPVFGIGDRERAGLSLGIDARRVVLIAFAIAEDLRTFGRMLLTDYAGEAAQAIRRPPTLLQTISPAIRSRRARRSSAGAAIISAPSPA